MNLKTTPRTPQKGFTIMELVLTVAIIGIVIGLVGPMLRAGIQSYSLVASRKASLSQTRLVMERLFYEIKLIPDTTNIDTWTSSEFQFDLPSEADINYSLSGSNLERSGAIMADNVSSLTFSYFDQDGNTAAAVGDIMRIRVEIVFTAPNNGGSLTIRDTIFPRGFATAYANFQ